jgi:integrase
MGDIISRSDDPREHARHAFRTFLIEDGDMAPSSAGTYARLAHQWIDEHGRVFQDPIEWLAQTIRPNTPQGTRDSYSAAVRWWLRYKGASKADAIQAVRKAIPKSRRSNPNETGFVGEALTEPELAEYRRAVGARCSAEVAAVLLLLPETGLRIGEAVCLRRGDIVRQGDAWGLEITRSWKPGGIGSTKGATQRWVPLNTRARAVINGWVKMREAEGGSTAGPLFPGESHGVLSPTTVRKQLVKARQGLLGNAANVHPHALRHTFATRLLLGKGVEARVVQQLLGHANGRTTERYTKPRAGDLAAAVEDLD